jgi:hypothetical protein
VERFNLKKEKRNILLRFQIGLQLWKIWTLEMDINSSWVMNRKNIKISAKESTSYYEFKKHKPWFGKGCSKLLDKRKQSKLQ